MEAAMKLFVGGCKPGKVACKLNISLKDAKHLYKIHIQHQTEIENKQHEEIATEERQKIVEENLGFIKEGFTDREMARKLNFIESCMPSTPRLIFLFSSSGSTYERFRRMGD